MTDRIPLIVNAGAAQIQELPAGDNISITGNITSNYFIGNGSQLTGISSSGNTFTAITMSDTPSGPSNQIKYGTGNLVSWLDGGWVIGEYNGTDYGTEGIRISPGIEGNVEVNLPSNQTANVNPLQLNNYAGNVVINANNNYWTFGNGGQTVFPVLSTQRGDNPSGTITGYTLVGGDGNQEFIISTPDGDPAGASSSSQRIVINPGAGNIDTSGEGGDIYLWAGRGGNQGGSGGDIKIRGGQGGGNSGAGGYIRMEAGDGDSTSGQAGYIDITGGSGGTGNPGGYVRITGGQGTTGGGEANIVGGYAYSGSGGAVNIIGGGSNDGLASYGNVVIAAGASTWAFDNTGNLNLPQTGVIYETNIPVGGLSGKTIALKPYGGTSTDQQLLVYPTAGADANHLHLTSGNLYNTELFLGDDNLYVKLANTGNVVINSNDSTGNSAQWIFGTAGTILNSGNLTLQTSSRIPNSVYNWQGGGGWNQSYYGDLETTGGTGTGLTVNVAAGGGGYINIGAISINNPGTGYTTGDVITINNENNIPGTFQITVLENEWILDTTGNLTVPGIIQNPAGNSQLSFSNGFRLESDLGNNSTYIDGQPNALFLLGGTDGTVVGAGANTWNFAANGNFTAPGNIVTTGNISVGNILAQNIRTIEGTVHVGQGAGLTNQGTYAIAMGRFAGGQNQGAAALAIGQLAGQINQGNTAIALGLYAAANTQSANAVAIGTFAGQITQSANAIAIGQLAANNAQSTDAVAIGTFAGQESQGANAIAIGLQAGNSTQGSLAVAIGQLAGANAQGLGGVAVGYDAGQYSQGNTATAVGAEAGRYYQSVGATAVGTRAGNWNQGAGAIAIGKSAAENVSNTGSQGSNAIAIGNTAGYIAQGSGAIAIGAAAGLAYQGVNSIAIGQNAGRDPSGSAVQAIGNNSIILNATGANLVGNTANAFYVNPVRNDTANIANIAMYNSTSKEITYANTVSIAGNITGGNILTAGIMSSTGNASHGNLTVTGQVLAGNGNITFPSYGFSSDGAIDTGFYWVSDGNIGVTNNGVQTAQFLPSGVFKQIPRTVGNLPSASSVGAGSRAFATDLNSTVFGNLAVGGGGTFMPVFSNGTNWYIG